MFYTVHKSSPLTLRPDVDLIIRLTQRLSIAFNETYK